MTVAHVSDLHFGKYTVSATMDRLVAEVNALGADLVLSCGDLVDLSLADLAPALQVLERLDPGAGLFLCEGNHDRIEDGAAFARGVRAAGFPLLLDEAVTVRVQGVPVQVSGLTWQHGDEAHRAAVERVRALRDPDAFPVLIAHHPHAFDAAGGFPLTLAGHTHGGQLMLTERLGAGPVVFRYWSGLYARRGRRLAVSNGIGNWFPLRIRAPAEVLHLTLYPE